jgi:hypothetical protein
MPNPFYPLRARLLNDYNIKRLETFFLMFIRDKQFDLLARNTNIYTTYQLKNYLEKHKKRIN